MTFSEPVLGFEQPEILVTEGTDVTITDFEPLSGGKDYVLTIAPAMARLMKLWIEAGVAHDAVGNENKPETIGVTISEGEDGSDTVTATLIDQPRTRLRPTPVNQNSIVFNEIRNAEDDTNDWLELKNISYESISLKMWEISIVNSSRQKR